MINFGESQCHLHFQFCQLRVKITFLPLASDHLPPVLEIHEEYLPKHVQDLHGSHCGALAKSTEGKFLVPHSTQPFLQHHIPWRGKESGKTKPNPKSPRKKAL